MIVHVVFRLATGGLENGLVNLINHIPRERYRHAVVSLTDTTDFRHRIQRNDVPIISLRKRPGHDLGAHARFWSLVRRLRPAVVHSRNLPSLEYVISAALAGAPVRVHGEHGRDVYDLDGARLKYMLFRKALRGLVHHYIGVSGDLADWLVDTVGVPRQRVSQISNGVDVGRFRPRGAVRSVVGPAGFAAPGTVVVGTVGRLETVKDQVTLVRAFIRLRETGAGRSLRLVVVGDGPLRAECLALLRAAGADRYAWLPGERTDVPEIMRGLDLFVLPSLREGTSNTILEAMATALPVVATNVGGNPEVVADGETGTLVPPAAPAAMAAAIAAYVAEPGRLLAHGDAGRQRVSTRFSLDAMVDRYVALYDELLHGRAREPRSGELSCAGSPAS